MAKKIDRRKFGQTSAATAVGLAALRTTTAPAAQIVGANERIRVGFIGVANRGSQLIDAFSAQNDMEIVALCDVDKKTLAKAREKVGGRVGTHSDFRELLDRKDIDAVAIATPDHWHALQTISACAAGMDVYCEKPLSITVHEGRRMVEAARRSKRVVQVGTHRRSSPLYTALAKRTTGGDFGKICVSRAYRVSNMHPNGIGREQPKAPPADLDWNMWLGPRPERSYQQNIAPYKFRWWGLYSSQMGNWGVHYLDAIRWCTGELAPSAICAMGGRFAVDDDRTIPDTLQTTFEFDSGRLAIFGQYETSGTRALERGEIELRGTKATLYVSASKYEVIPERGGQFQDRKPRVDSEEVTAKGGNADLTALHARNFLDCMRTREKPNADVEIGHRSTSMSLIANIALTVGARLNWDAAAERFTNSKEANQYLHYEYRKPWSLG